MTSLRQIEANRRNARLSTRPISEEGKRRSRQNAVRHGLTTETVIDALEDAEDFAAFEMAITTDFEAETAVERGAASGERAMAPPSRDGHRKWFVQDTGPAVAAISATTTGAR